MVNGCFFSLMISHKGWTGSGVLFVYIWQAYLLINPKQYVYSEPRETKTELIIPEVFLIPFIEGERETEREREREER